MIEAQSALAFAPLPGKQLPSGDCDIGGRHFRMSVLTADDGVEVRRLFAKVFQQSQNHSWFNWKYGSGHGEAVGLWDASGQLVANYSGIPRTLLWQGEPIKAVQIGDVMVAPNLRGLLTRKGLLFHLCAWFFGNRVGQGKSYRLAFGFPNRRHIRLGVALDLYLDAGPIHQLRWAARKTELPVWWQWSALTGDSSTLESTVAEVWSAMGRDMGDYVLGERNIDYLRWRFVDRPDRKYRLFSLRRWPTGGAVAVVVMRFAEGGAELLDVVGPRRTFAIAIAAAISEAAREGAPQLTAWASPAAAEVIGAEAQRFESGAFLAVARNSAMTTAALQAARWWWLGGDTDFL